MVRVHKVSAPLLAAVALAVVGTVLQPRTPSWASRMATPVQITYMYPGAVPRDLLLVQNAMNAILRKKINATVTLQPIDWGSYDQKMQLLFAAGQPCDAVFTAPWINNVYRLVANGALLPLDDLLKKDAPGLYASYRPYWKAVTINGHIYGVLNQQMFPVAWGIEVRADLAREIGLNLNAVHSYDDLTPVLAKLKATFPGVTPLYSDDQGSNSWQIYQPERFGYDPILGSGVSEQPLAAVGTHDRSLRVVDAAETAAFKYAVTLAYRWHQAGYYTTDPRPASDATAAFQAGKYAAVMDQWRPSGAEHAKLKAAYGWDFVGKSFTPPVITTANVNSTQTAICRTSKNPDTVMRFINLLNTDRQVYGLMTHGVEGKDYVWVDRAHNVIGLPPGVTTATDGYYPNTDWEFGNQFNAFYTSKDQIGSWAIQRRVNETTPLSVAFGFAPTIDRIKTQVAAVSAVVKQYGFPLQEGLVNPTTGLPAYIKALKAAGEDQILAEVQKQINAWSKANR